MSGISDTTTDVNADDDNSDAAGDDDDDAKSNVAVRDDSGSGYTSAVVAIGTVTIV